MILIKKKSEPHSLTTYKKTINASFDNQPSKVKEDLRKSLLEEQGYICAYCMKRIEESTDIKIEHYEARNRTNELSYKNLLVVCKGNEGSSKERQTCDTKKGNRVLHIDPQKIGDISTIFFIRNGEVKSTNLLFQKDLDEVLNLNDKFGNLISARKSALKALQKKITPMNKKQIEKLYNKLKSAERKIEYVGILLWYLEKKIKR